MALSMKGRNYLNLSCVEKNYMADYIYWQNNSPIRWFIPINHIQSTWYIQYISSMRKVTYVAGLSQETRLQLLLHQLLHHGTHELLFARTHVSGTAVAHGFLFVCLFSPLFALLWCVAVLSCCHMLVMCCRVDNIGWSWRVVYTYSHESSAFMFSNVINWFCLRQPVLIHPIAPYLIDLWIYRLAELMSFGLSI